MVPLYSHLEPPLTVVEGQKVQAGQFLGVVGRSQTLGNGGYGAHLTFLESINHPMARENGLPVILSRAISRATAIHGRILKYFYSLVFKEMLNDSSSRSVLFPLFFLPRFLRSKTLIN